MSGGATYRVTYTPPRRGLRFSRTELTHIAIAIAVLTLAFAFASGQGALLSGGSAGLAFFGLVLLASFLAVITAFLLHEMAHKVLAQRYGCWAEFRMDPRGLLIALFTAVFGIVFAAPGAVYIQGSVTRAENGKISAVGPLTNAAIATTSIATLLFLGGVLPPLGVLILGSLAFVNLILGAFNMIPFPPLDGSKVLGWNLGIYLGILGIIAGLFVFAWWAGLL